MLYRGLLSGPRARRIAGAAALACAASLLSACGPAKAPRTPATAAEVIREGRWRGLPVSNPLVLEPGILDEVKSDVGTWGDPLERLRRLVYYLNDGEMGFQYAPNLSLTASEAFRERRGDCMAYANLFIALARGLGLHVYFVHVSEVLTHYEHQGLFFTSSHVAVGYGTGPSALVIDFTRENADWKLSYYRSISDAAAVALYYNNVAVDAMMAGRLEDAEEMFGFLIEVQPEMEELYNNLGVLLNRRGRYHEALGVLEKGMEVSPDYKSFYTNALVAARGAGRADLEAMYQRRGQSIIETNPYFLFARGMGHYQSAQYVRAAEEWKRAASAKPDSPVILAWLARAYMSAGERARGREAFAEARRLAPKSRLLRDLTEQFPELGSERVERR